jgi:hypothetical protein
MSKSLDLGKSLDRQQTKKEKKTHCIILWSSKIVSQVHMRCGVSALTTSKCEICIVRENGYNWWLCDIGFWESFTSFLHSIYRQHINLSPVASTIITGLWNIHCTC